MEEHNQILTFKQTENNINELTVNKDPICCVCKKLLEKDYMGYIYFEPHTKRVVCEYCIKKDNNWFSGVAGMNEVTYFLVTIKKEV